MENRRSLESLYLAILAPVGAACAVWAAYGLQNARVGLEFVPLAVVTVFFSSFMRIQLPRTKIHLTISDGMVVLSMLLYGGEVAFVLALLESAFASFSLRRRGVTMRGKTIVVNMLIASLAVTATALLVRLLFGPEQGVLAGGDATTFIWLLVVMALALFVVHSFGVSLFIAAKSGKPVLSVWNEYCVNLLVMFLSSAVLAGFTAKALQQINFLLFAAVAGFFGLVYFTYRRYIEDIKKTAAVAEQAERERAEQAENHVRELEHYVEQLQASSEALRKSREEFRHAAYHDALTGLPNKDFFIGEINRLLDASHQDVGRRFAILYLDLDRFKTVNDSLGHSAGDRMIRIIAERLCDAAGEGNIVSRFGGDEFAVLIPEVDTGREATELAERIARGLAEPLTVSGRQVFTSASVGVAFGPAVYKWAADLLRDADIAMYHAKETKQKCVTFDHDMHARAVNRLQLETDLRRAIECDEFVVFYQPIIALEEMSTAGFEALVRWNHPTRGLVSPAEFIPLCEATDLIVPLTLRILTDACRQVKAWSDSAGRPLFVSVNLSGRHFDHEELVEHVGSVLLETDFDPRCLKLEITETAVMENAESAIAMLRRIKQLGVQISVDDFGTGYSSLSYLHRFPIDTLKIDRSFVTAIKRGSGGEIVATIVTLAKGLHLNVVAEGIESIDQLERLRTLGCEYGQGYLFSRPLPAADTEKFLMGQPTPWHLPADIHITESEAVS